MCKKVYEPQNFPSSPLCYLIQKELLYAAETYLTVITWITVSIMQSVDWIWYQPCGLMKIQWSRVKKGAEESKRIAETLHFQRKKRWSGQATEKQFAQEARTAKMVNRSTYQESHYWERQKKTETDTVDFCYIFLTVLFTNCT